MPTPVSAARQCLTAESAHALDEAVAVARRRGHGQTTSLHAVSALLSLPSSILRDACARARNSAYSPRLQFRALDLCLSVSLDRVPSSQLTDDPPVSNSLMAAIKRSQANQRRQPENFHLYHQISQQSSSVSCVKVELQHLILSILDDPVVSRVFSEAGFRSSEVKLAIVRPLPQLLRYSRSRAPPLFLCNLTEHPDPGPRGRSFSFPFSGFPAFFGGDENSRRIGELLARNKGRNPLLVGVCAYDALKSFIETVRRKKDDVLPIELSGLNIVCIENDISKFIVKNFDKENVNLKFEEVGKVVEQSFGPGLVVNYGDLKVFVNESNGCTEAVSYVVAQLTKLWQRDGGRVWLMGAAASYETYLKFLGKFPSIEKDWELQLLPITSLRPSNPMADSSPRSSLMESFVPFGGFFSTPSELKGTVSNSYSSAPHCHLCNEKCEQEVHPVSEGAFTTSVADHYQSSLPSWLQMTELGTNNLLDVKTKDDQMVLVAKAAELQKKRENNCQLSCYTQIVPKSKNYQVGSEFPTSLGFQLLQDRKENADDCSPKEATAPCDEQNIIDLNSSMPHNLQKISLPKMRSHCPVVSQAKTGIFLSKSGENASKTEHLESGGLSSPCSLSNQSIDDSSRTSLTSVTSVSTDLGLGLSVSTCNEPNKPTKHQQELLQDCFSANISSVNRSLARSSASSNPNCSEEFDTSTFKSLFRALTERVGWQDEAVSVISRTIARHQIQNRECGGASFRGDIWFNFAGPDRSGKKKIAVSLAKVMYGSRDSFIYAGLSSQEAVSNTYTVFELQEMVGFNEKLRGKTLVDYIAGELCKKPLSIVFLEDVDKADEMAQSCLYQALQTGKFADSHGREVGISNAIFVTTSTFMKDDKIFSSRKESCNFSEEKVLRAKGCSVRILIEHASSHRNISTGSSVSVSTKKCTSTPIFLNKRKLVGATESPEQHEISEVSKRAYKSSARCLDLNLPAEENDVKSSDNDSVSKKRTGFLQNFFDQVDETVIFKPFDFDSLADKISNQISESFNKVVGSKSSLEVDSRVMEQLLAAAYLSDKKRVVEDWVEVVLNRAFEEIHRRYNLTAHSVVKLVTYEGLVPGKQTTGDVLPSEIIIN